MIEGYSEGKKWIDRGSLWRNLKLWQRILLIPLYLTYTTYAIITNQHWVMLEEEKHLA